MYIDSHCHINSPELRSNARGVISRAHSAGVGKMLIVGCDYEDSCEAAALAENFSQFGLYASAGVHPHEAERNRNILSYFGRLINHERVVAVGEIGLDYHYDNSPREVQREVFEAQLNFASENGMPVVLHIRDAMKDALDILKYYRGMRMLFHCYSGGLEYLDAVLDLEGMCAFGGALTWHGKSTDDLRETLRRIPLDNVLFETDSPYMTPVPFRGKVNEPAYVKYVYEAASLELGMEIKELESRIESNAQRFFSWEDV